MIFQNKPASGNERSHVALTLDRRGFLRAGATLGAGFLLPETIGCSSDENVNPHSNPVANRELFTPASVRSQDGVLDIEVTVTEVEVTVGQYTFMTRAYTGLKVNQGQTSFGDGTYTGVVPGPTLEVRPGDRFNVKLINQLPDDSTAVDPPDHCQTTTSSSGGAHGGIGAGTHNNSTNLHTHGLHVDPGDPEENVYGDDVFVTIKPGESRQFRFDIPRDLDMGENKPKANHPAGTYWYHPHMHGSTAIQVAGGMVGTIIIRDEENDDLDKLFSPEPGPGQGKEQLLVVGEFILNTKGCDGKTRLATYGEMGHAKDFPPGVVDFFHVNGQLNPIIRMRPSEVQRFRVLHTGFRAPLDIAFLRVPDDQVDAATSLPKPGYDPFGYSCVAPSGGPPVLNRDALRAKSATYYQVATDGITYGAPLKMPLADAVSEVEYVIPPGGRVDMLVQFEAGTYQMVALGYLDFVCWDPQVLATVVVSGEPDTSLQIPQALTPPALYPPFDDPPFNDPSAPATRTLTFAFSKGPDFDPKNNPDDVDFTIDGRKFCASRVDQCVAFGAVEKWTILNKVKDLGETVHPFHIHVNSFLVTSINGKTPARPIWRDTCLIPTNAMGADGELTFLSRFLHFNGKYVLHCHILEHEDEGMMQNVEVQEAACPPPPVDDSCKDE